MKLLTIFFPALILVCSSAFAQGIANGDFELGRNNGWAEYSQGGYTLIGTEAFFASTSITPTVTPRSGLYMGRIGGYSYEVNSLSQTVALPNTTPLYLKIYIQTRSASSSECSGVWVGARIRVSIAGQTIYDTYLCHYNDIQNWTSVYFGLTAVAGQTVQIIFQADAANSVWSYLYADDIGFTNQISDVEKQKSLFPINFELKQNYPNPFNSGTIIEFFLPKRETVSLKIFNSIGEEVATLVNEELPAGAYNKRWNANDIASGTYFVRLHAGGFIETKKIMLLK